MPPAHPTGKSGIPWQPCSPHTRRPLWPPLQSPLRLDALAARAVPEAQDAAPTPRLLSTLTLLQPRSPPVPRSQPQTARRSLQRPTVHASVVVCLPPPPGQPDTNAEIFAQRTLAQSTPPFPSAPACLTASAVQRIPSAT